MRKGTYAYLDGIPDRTSDLYNDGGFLNEAEVQAEIGNYLDIDDATAGQVLTMGESGFPEWEDVASGGVDYSTTEQDTGTKWIDGKEIYCITIDKPHVGGAYETELMPASSNVNLVKYEGYHYSTRDDFKQNIGSNAAANKSSHIYQFSNKRIVVNFENASSDFAKDSFGWHIIITLYYTKNS